MSNVAPSARRGGGLSRRFMLGSLLATFVSLLVFAASAFVVLVLSEVAEPNAPSAREIDWEVASNVLVAMAIALPPSLGLAIAASVLAARRVVRPIAEVVRAARDTTAENLARRLPVPDADDELRDLVIAENALFARLEAGFGALSRFTADASHEVRTPLAVIESELEVAMRRPRTDEEWREVAARALEEVGRLTRIMESLLELARTDAGQVRVDDQTEIHPVLERLTASFKPEAGARGLSLDYEATAPFDLAARMSEPAFAIAVSNLIANALRYCEPGSRVRLSVEGGTTRATVYVDDDGFGLSHDDGDVFQPFVRGHRFRAEDVAQTERGTGLGLSIARRLVEHWGGGLSASVSPLGGARFAIELPIAPQP